MSRILIIEDQSDIRRLIRMTLEFENHEIHEATHGQEGLAMAATLRPDLILCDVMMPGGLDGLQVCTRLKADPALAGVPVWLLTARAQAKDRDAGEKAGADGYLVKPFSPLELIDTVDGILRQSPPRH